MIDKILTETGSRILTELFSNACTMEVIMCASESFRYERDELLECILEVLPLGLTTTIGFTELVVAVLKLELIFVLLLIT